MPLTRLATYVLSLPVDDRRRRRAELTEALEAAADRVAGVHRGSWGKVSAVLDDSYSAFGSVHKRRRPLAVALAWEEWSQRAIRQGLSPRVEEAYAGADVHGLADALRVFEIHPHQCGVMVYVADALAAAFVVPHPDDYRALHPTLLRDLYGELIHHYATLMPPVPDFRARIPDAGIRSLAHLRTAVAEQERDWTRFHDTSMATSLLAQAYTWQSVHRMGRFTLSRFLPTFRPKQENHIGEAITDDSGRIAYLKTFRLSENQVRRGHLLSRLAANDWHLASTAADLGVDEARLGLRLESAGFGFLLRQDVLDEYRKQRGRTRAGADRR
ncbi:ARPP-2 domain-containing protein [Streptomyces sp. NPDC002386]